MGDMLGKTPRDTFQFSAYALTTNSSPGRFFAANQLKLLLAAIVTKYDIEPIAERPPNPWLNNSIGPPIWSKLRVRRRPEINASVPVRVDSPMMEPQPDSLAGPLFTVTREPSIAATLLDSKVMHSLVGAHELLPPIKVQG